MSPEASTVESTGRSPAFSTAAIDVLAQPTAFLDFEKALKELSGL